MPKCLCCTDLFETEQALRRHLLTSHRKSDLVTALLAERDTAESDTPESETAEKDSVKVVS